MNDIFRRLREQTLENPGAATFSRRPALAPIEQTVDGWFCLQETGNVVHWSVATDETEPVVDAARKALSRKR